MVYSGDQEFKIAADDSDGSRNLQLVSCMHMERTEPRVGLARSVKYGPFGKSFVFELLSNNKLRYESTEQIVLDSHM